MCLGQQILRSGKLVPPSMFKKGGISISHSAPQQTGRGKKGFRIKEVGRENISQFFFQDYLQGRFLGGGGLSVSHLQGTPRSFLEEQWPYYLLFRMVLSQCFSKHVHSSTASESPRDLSKCRFLHLTPDLLSQGTGMKMSIMSNTWNDPYEQQNLRAYFQQIYFRTLKYDEVLKKKY